MQEGMVGTKSWWWGSGGDKRNQKKTQSSGRGQEGLCWPHIAPGGTSSSCDGLTQPPALSRVEARLWFHPSLALLYRRLLFPLCPCCDK